MNLIRLIIITLPVLLFVSCNNNTAQKEELKQLVQYWQEREIIFPDSSLFSKYGTGDLIPLDSLSNKPYKVLVYTDSIGCVSCKLHLDRWKKLISYTDSVSNHSVAFLFYFHSNDFEDLNYILRRDRFSIPVCFDKNDELNRLNKFPSTSNFQTFLLNTDNRVIAMGNPVNLPKVKDLYLKIIEGKEHLAPQAPPTEIEIERQEINIGKFDFNTSKKVVFALKNTGKNPLIIKDVLSSCGCTSVSFNENPIEKSERTEIMVEIKPEAKGAFKETITVYCNAKQSPIILKITGFTE